ncbi:EF-hand domain-containing protein [Photobacterium chitinilyticum]|uniref:EF-hand domain-containing protein n=2 Tax=Photobacterium chitinilyticum TaxID=2485123 RepID=A0A3S3UKU7_9GAMM|nr:EF-hand domain-containing protein [Photobacterium chitinilyticum]
MVKWGYNWIGELAKEKAMNRYILPILLGCLTISLSVDAIERGNGRMSMSQPPVFSDFDANQDGLISEDEFENFQKARQEQRISEGRLLRNSVYSDGMFDRIDVDHNEFIDADEFQSHRGTMKSSKS